MKIAQLTGKTFYVLTYVINVVLVLQVFGRIGSWELSYFFNSDGLYLPSIYKDLFEDKTGLNGWNLNASPNVIPEWPAYFIIRWLCGDFRIAAVFYSVFTVFIINLLTAGILVKAFEKVSYNFLSLSNITYSIVLLFYFTDNDFLNTSYLFATGYHLGVFIMSLLSIYLFFNYLNSGKRRWLLLLFLSVLSGTFSDRLLIMFFVVPSLTAFFFIGNKNLRRNIIVSNISNAIAAFLGIVLFNLLKGSDYIYFVNLGYRSTNFEEVGPAFQHYIRTVNELMESGGTPVLMTILSIIGLVFGIYFSLIYVLTKKKLFAVKTTEKIGITLFTAFVVLVTLTPIGNGTFLGLAHLRYNIYAFFLAQSLLVVILFMLIRKRQKIAVLSNLIVPVILLFVFVIIGVQEMKKGTASGLTKNFNYYPSDVAIIDSIAITNKLKYGIANYWHAKRTTMFSKHDIRLYAVFPNLSPWFHVTNKHWYFRQNRGKYGDPKFNFILLNSLDYNYPDTGIFQNQKVDTLKGRDIRIIKVPEFEYKKNKKPVLIPLN